MTLQIFFLVILFAAYNGLVVLPVLLSIAGPSHHSTFRAIAKALAGKKGEQQLLSRMILKLGSYRAASNANQSKK